jgi:hypothetical protein
VGLVAVALALAALVSAGAARAGDDEWSDDGDVVVREAWHRADFQKLAVKFPVGTLEVIGTTRDSIVLVLEPRCELGSDEDCEKAIRRIHVRERRRGKTLELAVVGTKWFDTSRVQIEARLEVPRDLALQVGMKVGELEVSGLASDTRLDLGVGEAMVRSSERPFRKASVRVMIGEATLVRDGHTRGRAGVLGNSLDWERGAGTAALGLHVGIGEASVYLD